MSISSLSTWSSAPTKAVVKTTPPRSSIVVSGNRNPWAGTFSGVDRRTTSSFNNMMARNSRPIRGEILSVGPYKTDAYYRNQSENGGVQALTRDEVNELIRGDLGLDDQGNQVDIDPLNLPDAPTYTAPEVDEAGVDRYSRSNLAPMLSMLRNALNKNIVTNKNVDNVNVRKELTRGAMAGYGEGLSNATASARNTGRRDYMNMEYQPKVQAAQMNYATDANKYRTAVTDIINRRNRAMSAYANYRT